MHVQKTPLEGLLVIETDVFGDGRGFFMESYQKNRYRDIGIDVEFIQDNVSLSKKGVVRGLHFQRAPFVQGKLVSVLAGRAFDVAVDIRNNSVTFGKWFGIELSSENHKQFWIPEGFAHGFMALEDSTVFVYKCTNVYSAAHDGGILWNDPEIGIVWPLAEAETIVSEKDRKHPTLEMFLQNSK